MRFTFPIRWMCVCLVLAGVPVSAQDVDRYREFQLGSSTAAVVGLTGITARDLRTIHARPSLLQELTWRPRYGNRRSIPDVDPVREIVFSFYDDQLYGIKVEYDQTRTAGLTDADVIDALTVLYGPQTASPLPRRRASLSTSVTPTPIAHWLREGGSVLLYKLSYNSVFSLVVSSAALTELARNANAAAITMNAREAPVREAALEKQRVEDAKAAEEKTRATNKGAFRP